MCVGGGQGERRGKNVRDTKKEELQQKKKKDIKENEIH